MKYLVALLAAVFMCAVFVPIANGLSCYKCSWTDKTCTEKFDKTKGKSEPCNDAGSVTTAAPGGGAAPAAPAAPDAPVAPAGFVDAPENALRVMRSQKLLSHLAETPKPSFHCFAVAVKMNGTTTVERGCKNDDKTTDCVKVDKPGAEVLKCSVCHNDNCNGGVSVTASALLCVLVPAILVGQIFFQAK